MKKTNRRGFFRTILTGIGGMIIGFIASRLMPWRVHKRVYSPGSTGYTRIVYRDLGSTGFKVSEIGFGAMNMRDSELVHAAIDEGINFIDTAHGYMEGANERIIGEVMRTKRDRVFLTTKIDAAEPARMTEMVKTSLSRLRTDYVDLLLFHSVGPSEILNDDYRRVFDDARSEGLTRFVGYSTHSFSAEILDATLADDFWEAVLVMYHFLSGPEASENIRKAREAGRGVITMKSIVRGIIDPTNTENIASPTAALRWVLDNPYVDTVIPGITSFEQLAEDVAVMGSRLTEDDRQALNSYHQSIAGHYCLGTAGCTECSARCPHGVPIPDILRCMGYAYGYGNIALARENFRRLPDTGILARCADCSECSVRCVNGLDLTEHMRRAGTLFA